jgi:MazG family protein
LPQQPHVFANKKVNGAREVLENWEQIKKKEGRQSILEGVPKALPALQQAQRLTEKASRVGFDWPDLDGVIAKFEEEFSELKEAISKGKKEEIISELGDLCFATANIARYLNFDSEQALRQTNKRFIRRFNYIEKELKKQGKEPQDSNLKEMDALWNEAKKKE